MIRHLRRIQVLIIDAEDLVILSPPSLLASVPLHGIPLDDKPLIERNPVIYSSSISIYRHVLARLRQMNHLKDRAFRKAVFTAVYEEEGREVEKSLVYECVDELAMDYNSKTITGSNLTAASFRQAPKSAPWIHYHGHVFYEKSEAIKQSFVLSGIMHEEKMARAREKRPKTNKLSKFEKSASGGHTSNARDAQESVDGEIKQLERRLTESLQDSSRVSIADTFAMDLSSNTPFVCNIVCNSGMQDVGAGDEPLVLVSAILASSASSVLEILWQIPSEPGREFSNCLYRCLPEQGESNRTSDSNGKGRKVLDLAVVLSDAVRKLKREKNKPEWKSP